MCVRALCVCGGAAGLMCPQQAYADVCWRTLMYAGVCWRMLTYADVVVCGLVLYGKCMRSKAIKLLVYEALSS